MIGSFSELFQSVWTALQPARHWKKTGRRRARLSLEALEDRYLLAGNTWLWVAEHNADWNADPNYWRDTVHNEPGIPAEGDHLLFNPGMTIDGKQGSNWWCWYDGGAMSFASVSFNENSTASLLLLPEPMSVITITDNVTMAAGRNMTGGTITSVGGGRVEFANNTRFDWTGGRISARLYLGAPGVTNVTTTISGFVDTRTIAGDGMIFNYGTITLEGTRANIRMERSELLRPHIWNYGTFDIRRDDDDIRPTITGAGGFILNEPGGTFQKTLGTGTATIEAEFFNSGTFLLGSGVVKFTGPAEQQAAVGGLTRLNGGNLETTSTYYVWGGRLEGVGTITGNLALHHPSNPQLGGELIPGFGGFGGTPGTLNIAGNFTMGPGGILGINIDADGNTGLLRVQQGSATLDGILWVNRHPDYRPDVVGTTRTFLEYTSVAGDFFHIEIFNNSWSTGGPRDPLFHFEPDPQATSYRLIVQAG